MSKDSGCILLDYSMKYQPIVFQFNLKSVSTDQLALLPKDDLVLSPNCDLGQYYLGSSHVRTNFQHLIKSAIPFLQSFVKVRNPKAISRGRFEPLEQHVIRHLDSSNPEKSFEDIHRVNESAYDWRLAGIRSHL